MFDAGLTASTLALRAAPNEWRGRYSHRSEKYRLSPRPTFLRPKTSYKRRMSYLGAVVLIAMCLILTMVTSFAVSLCFLHQCLFARRMIVTWCPPCREVQEVVWRHVAKPWRKSEPERRAFSTSVLSRGLYG